MTTSQRPAGPFLILDEDNIADYLASRRLVEGTDDALVRKLSGGYVNNVFRVEAGGSIYIVKQSLPASRRTVLKADIGRALVEVAAMKAIKSLLGPAAPIPSILDDDPQNYVSVMTSAPPDSVLYEDELLDGRFHPGTGRRLGGYAGHLHDVTCRSPEIAREFGSNPGFALRDQSIRSASRANPDLAALIEDRLRRNRDEARVLVDADITPKNVLVHRGGITKLDFECTQWGHPAFDVGIILAHFVLVGFARPQWGRQFLTEADGCYRAYAAIRDEAHSSEFAGDVARYAAVMMLGRADGDLVFDYLVPHRRALRSLVRRLAAGVSSIDEFLGLTEAALGGLSSVPPSAQT